MRIRRLYLGDFGIFQNQTMDHIGSGLVVVGGLNRAGKTTLMSALRFLGYGIPKGGSIPPAAGQHEIRADVENNGYGYSVFVHGHGYPRVGAMDQAPEIDIDELYNNLDRFTYNQVFSISLDELRQVPDNIDNGDQGRVSAVLLGAGWSDALRLIQLKDTLHKNATDMGGKNGSINTKKFQPHYDQLCSGLELRDQANAQLDMYEVKCKRLGEVESELIPALQKNIAVARQELQRLELIRDRHTKYQIYKLNKRLLEEEQNRRLLETYPPGGRQQAQRLKEQYEIALNKVMVAQEKFSALTGHDGASEMQTKLLENAGELESYVIRISGWEARIDAVKNSKEELDRINNELKADLEELYGVHAESEPLILLNFVKADQINEQSLRHIVSRHTELQNDLRHKESDLAELEGELVTKISQLNSLPSADSLVRKVAWLVGANVLVTVALSLFLPASVAVAVGLSGAVAILAYFLKENSMEQTKVKQEADLKKEISDRQTNKQALLTRHAQMSGELEKINNSITCLKEECHIPNAVEVAFLPEFLRRIRDLQRVSAQIYSKNNKLAQAEEELLKELAPVLSLLKHLGLLDEAAQNVIGAATAIFRKLENCFAYATLARELQSAANDKVAVEEKILQLLKGEDPAKHNNLAGQSLVFSLEAFMDRGLKHAELTQKWLENNTLQQVLASDLDTQRWRLLLLGEQTKNGAEGDALLSAFAFWCEAFTSVAEIEAKHHELETEIISREKELQLLNDEKRDLTKEIADLGSDSKLLEAKKQIDEAKNKLSSILEKYAIHRVAAFMLERVQEKLVEKTRDTLLAPASEIFSMITGKSYGNIELPSGKEQGAFKARLSNGREQPLEALSRGTREQLFFAMRFSRIRDIKPPLPVILDDTFANYDPIHAREAVKCLMDLARTHQVFVLTCHPELLACLDACGGTSACQFWGLQKGRITGPYDTSFEVNKLLLQGSF